MNQHLHNARTFEKRRWRRFRISFNTNDQRINLCRCLGIFLCPCKQNCCAKIGDWTLSNIKHRLNLLDCNSRHHLGWPARKHRRDHLSLNDILETHHGIILDFLARNLFDRLRLGVFSSFPRSKNQI